MEGNIVLPVAHYPTVFDVLNDDLFYELMHHIIDAYWKTPIELSLKEEKTHDRYSGAIGDGYFNKDKKIRLVARKGMEMLEKASKEGCFVLERLLELDYIDSYYGITYFMALRYLLSSVCKKFYSFFLAGNKVDHLVSASKATFRQYHATITGVIRNVHYIIPDYVPDIQAKNNANISRFLRIGSMASENEARKLSLNKYCITKCKFLILDDLLHTHKEFVHSFFREGPNELFYLRIWLDELVDIIKNGANWSNFKGLKNLEMIYDASQPPDIDVKIPPSVENLYLHNHYIGRGLNFNLMKPIITDSKTKTFYLKTDYVDPFVLPKFHTEHLIIEVAYRTLIARPEINVENAVFKKLKLDITSTENLNIKRIIFNPEEGLKQFGSVEISILVRDPDYNKIYDFAFDNMQNNNIRKGVSLKIYVFRLLSPRRGITDCINTLGMIKQLKCKLIGEEKDDYYLFTIERDLTHDGNTEKI
jgi:hypothetical protein